MPCGVCTASVSITRPAARGLTTPATYKAHPHTNFNRASTLAACPLNPETLPYTAVVDTVLVVPAAEGLLRNARPDALPRLLSTFVAQPASGGSVVVDADSGAFTFTPTPGASGTATFTSGW